MKKTVTLPDGTKQEIEGSPEEIAQYERQLREQGSGTTTGKKKILNEEVRVATDDMNTCRCGPCVAMKKIFEETAKVDAIVPYTLVDICQHEYPSPWMATIPPSCIKCGKSASWLMPTTTCVGGTVLICDN